jgi:DNA invertase Pin-like site-specific DNA recombinase
VIGVAVQAKTIREMHAAGSKPAHIAKELGVARSSVYRFRTPVVSAGVHRK